MAAVAGVNGGGVEAERRRASMTPRKPEPAEIEYRGVRFLITDRPTDATLDKYIQELRRHGALDVVRVCDPTYDDSRLAAVGVTVTDLPFSDGTGPPASVVESFLELLRTRLRAEPGGCVAVHCVAGLGRAPVLVAIALVELGMKYEDAVELIRTKRRGAINAKQLAYLEKYRAKSRLRVKGIQKSCCVM